MKIDLNVNAAIKVNNMLLELNYNTSDHESHDISINGDSIYYSDAESTLAKLQSIKDLPNTLLTKLKFLCTDYSVLPYDSYAILSNKKIANELNNEKGEELPTIITGIDYINLPEGKQKAYEVLTPYHETLLDRYELMNDIIAALGHRITKLIVYIDISTSTTDMTLTIIDDQIHVKQSVTIDGKTYRNLSTVDIITLDKDDAKEFNNLLISSLLKDKLCMDITNRKIFTVPLYICKLKEESDTLPYIQAFTNCSQIPYEYEIVFKDEILHDQYLKLLSDNTPVPISPSDTLACMKHIIYLLKYDSDNSNHLKK